VKPKYLQNDQSIIEPELTVDPAPFRTSPALSPAAKDSRPENLWDEAYNALRKKDSKLIDAYEKDLLASQDQHEQGTSRQLGFFLDL
jgi:hypothetical protein